MADCGSVEDGRAAVDAGVDVLGTTLVGYTDERPRTDGPDLELVAEMCALGLPVVVEGRIRTPEHVARAFAEGAHAVCVGTASITGWFVAAAKG